MIITVTETEAKRIIAEHFTDKVVTKVVITKPRNVNTSLALLYKVIGEVERFRYTTDEKIPAIKAIKAFRQFMSDENLDSSLALAKYVVENWDEFKRIAISKKRIPNFQYSSGAGGMYRYNFV